MPDKESVTIWHNPNCSTSRKVLAAMKAQGADPKVVEYLKTPPSRAEIARVCKLAGIAPMALVRRKGDAWAASGLADDPDDKKALDCMAAEPVLIERPVVITATGARLCRPPEKWTELF